MGEQVRCNTPPHVGKVVQLVSPEIPIQEYTMDEKSYGAAAALHVANAAGGRLDAASIFQEIARGHEKLPFAKVAALGSEH
jgi:hypothetical protein